MVFVRSSNRFVINHSSPTKGVNNNKFYLEEYCLFKTIYVPCNKNKYEVKGLSFFPFPICQPFLINLSFVRSCVSSVDVATALDWHITLFLNIHA